MSDDMEPISFADFQKPRTPKRKTAPAPVVSGDPSDKDVAREAASLVADSERLKGKSVEELAEMAIRRNANVVLLGGDAFLPTSLSEATQAAKAWAAIASLERARLGGKGGSLTDDDPVSKMAARTISQFRELSREAKK